MSRLPEKFEHDDVSQVVVKLKDGSSWIAEYDSAGRLTPVRELGGPPEPERQPEIAPGPGSGKIPETAEEYFERATPALKGKPLPTSEDMDYEDEDEDEAFEHMFEHDEPEPFKPMSDNVFRARLSSIMTDNMFDRNIKGRSRGKLDMKRLWKAKTGATNLFMQKQARKNKEYNVVLLVDESGSMDGPKIHQAAEIACFLAKAFDGLNLNLAIVGFNHYTMLHKSFDGKLPDAKLLYRTITQNVHGANGGGYNNDYEALAFGYKLFKGRPGKNFLIMMSDGSPAPSSRLDWVLEDPKRLEEGIERREKWAVKKKDPLGNTDHFWVDTSQKLDRYQRSQKKHLNHLVNSQTNVTSIGIGVDSDCWQIPTHFNESDIEKLKPVILQEIRKQITRG